MTKLPGARRERYYHPGRSRFVSEDPILCASGDLNFYAYVRNNPVRFSDPNGLAPGLVLPPPRPWRVNPACFVFCSVERIQREIYCGVYELNRCWRECTILPTPTEVQNCQYGTCAVEYEQCRAYAEARYARCLRDCDESRPKSAR